MTKPNEGKIATVGLELDSACDVCGKNRAHGNHKRCSKVRQQRYRALSVVKSIWPEGRIEQ
ncbi:TPA: hypothetical protein P6M69_000574 [Pseudomonas aeruginosa]|uniref:hypothetical protein n=1 Tax=Pseudomonas aeruginosa TaxID=287 RepID=UPI000F5381B1|nr:hypothetical protein [Pseudomonas aeruginosa]MBG5440162.1 hypothetical protein [Pseudomonas aeruginosa]MBH8644144.1 hypothetical protein [Pseudomonas aeruginosa]MBV6169352.1 hypothetical protein [Pseudomonas aeruginosa]MBV6202433.1 hypothetical protein [Pseudomonas aeruginosa]MCO2584841.1 hypothetical protein [Pseudomonas aeruginosa]